MYPANGVYAANMKCRWRLHAPAGMVSTIRAYNSLRIIRLGKNSRILTNFIMDMNVRTTMVSTSSSAIISLQIPNSSALTGKKKKIIGIKDG